MKGEHQDSLDKEAKGNSKMAYSVNFLSGPWLCTRCFDLSLTICKVDFNSFR